MAELASLDISVEPLLAKDDYVAEAQSGHVKDSDIPYVTHRLHAPRRAANQLT